MRLKVRVKARGLFKPPKHRWLAEIVTFKTPKAAREAARKLVNALKRRRLGSRRIGRKTALTIARALNYAANRAAAAARSPKLSAKERRELVKISQIYRRAAEQAFKLYHAKYKKG